MSSSTLYLDDQLGLRIVNLALMKGLITPDEWSIALAEQASESSLGREPRPLCRVLFERGTLTRDQLHRLRVEAAERPPIPRPAAPPAPPSPLPASSDFGRFRLLREIGRGPRGTVHEAVDGHDGRRVALKIFGDDGGDPGVFHREARAVLRLPPHPGLVRLLDNGVENGRRWLAMELVEGPDFERWSAERRDLRAQIDALRFVAEAVHHAHAQGVVHREIKPRNILIDAKGRPRLSDLGTSRLAPRSQDSPYSSPEQIRKSRDVGPRSDVYALGAILRDVVARSGAEDVALDAVRRKATGEDPAGRFASAAEFADELGRWIDGRPLRSGPSRWPWAVAAVALLGALAAGLWLLLRS